MKILILLFISFFSFSQEEQYRSEFAWCNLKEGNSIDDAKNIASKYGEFVESVGSQYEQSFLAPMHAGEFEYDYVLWGSWPDGQSMYEEWGSYLNDYEKPAEVADCKKWRAVYNFLVGKSEISSEKKDEKKPVQFAACKFTASGNNEKLFSAAKLNESELIEYGFKGWKHHYLFPYLGWEDEFEFDFIQVFHWDSFESRATMAQQYVDFSSKYPENSKRFERIAKCSGQNSFYEEFIFSNWN